MLRKLLMFLMIIGMLMGLISYSAHGSTEDGVIDWIKQFTSYADSNSRISGTAIHNGEIYVTGFIDGFLPGYTGAGGTDAFVRKYDSAGNVIWMRQFGTSSYDCGNDIAADASGVYVTGYTTGSLEITNLGYEDAFIRKYDLYGNVLWTKQFGTSSYDISYAVAVDASGVYVTGYTQGSLGGPNAGQTDTFVWKCNLENGDFLWTKQFGTSSADYGLAVAVDISGVYVTGYTQGSLEGQNKGYLDAFIRKYSSGGVESWTKQFGTSSADAGYAVAVDISGVYVTGYTQGSLEGPTKGGMDVFIRKYALDGSEVLWAKQFGSSGWDYGQAVAVDASGVYVAGHTQGSLGGPNAGKYDAFVWKCNLEYGDFLWAKQFGTSSDDSGSAVAVDASGVYVTGYTYGSLGAPNLGGSDAYIRKYDSAGIEGWTDQFGSINYASDTGYGVAADASGVYMTGSTSGTLPGQASAGGDRDAYIRKYGSDGNELWTRQFGTSGYDEGKRTAVDASGVYVVGETTGTLAGQNIGSRDVFIRKYNSAGDVLWTRQFGTTGADYATSITVAASGVYVTGYTNGSLGGPNAGENDAFVRKYDLDGDVIWTSQFGTSADDQGSGIAADASGVYVTGHTRGSLEITNLGYGDAFIRKYDLAGNVLWAKQFGSTSWDYGRSVAVDASGVYVVGNTGGALPGQSNMGSNDAFIRKYDLDSNELWTRQFGTSSDDQTGFVAVDATGVYAAGHTFGSLGGPNAGKWDAFVRKYGSAGNALWTRQFGTSVEDLGHGIAADESGVYVTGFTYGKFPDQADAGGTEGDAYVVRFAPAITNQPPVANAGQDQTKTDTDGNGMESVTLDGSGSYDPDGTIASYLWAWNGESASGANPTISLPIGITEITLTVTDDKEATGTDTVTITVNPNTPVSPPGEPTVVVLESNTITFDNVTEAGSTKVTSVESSNQQPPPGANFMLLDNDMYFDITTTAAYSGEIEVCLTYDDSDLTSWQEEFAIDLYHYVSGDWEIITTFRDLKGNVICGRTSSLSHFAVFLKLFKPTAVIVGPSAPVYDNTSPLGVEEVQLDGSGSSDLDGTIVSYEWKEGATIISNAASPTFALSVGQHDLTLTVTDNDGLTDTASISITVNPAQVDVIMQLVIADVSTVDSKNAAGLTAKLLSALDAYVNVKGKDYNAAINKLNAFINACNADSLLSIEDRERLVGKANFLIEVIRSKI